MNSRLRRQRREVVELKHDGWGQSTILSPEYFAAQAEINRQLRAELDALPWARQAAEQIKEQR